MSALPALHLTPSDPDPETPEDQRTLIVAARFRDVMQALGLDLEDPTSRARRCAWRGPTGELFAGLDPAREPVLRTFPNTEGYSQIVAVTDIRFHSLCAHHFLPFFGTAHLAYLPKDRVVGLSKLARIVEHYARRPQIQERLTEQVIELLEHRLRPAGAIVIVQARHMCMEMRGVHQPGATTRTSAWRGAFADARTRQEFLDLLPTSAP